MEKPISSTHTVYVRGRITDEDGARIMSEVSRIVSEGGDRLSINLKDADHIGSRGAAWLMRAARTAEKAGAVVTVDGARGEVADFIKLVWEGFKSPPEPTRQREIFFERIGGKAFAALEELKDACRLIVDAVYWSFIAPLEGRGLRWKSLLVELNETGVKAIGIVSLLNFLLGLVIAMLSASQAGAFGVQIFVANLVVIGFAKELAVVMTGIVVSARTGSAIAAELATMKVYEEIDALKGMGLSVPKFLIAPKVIAILVAMPILTAIGFVTGVAGGFVLGVFSLGYTFQSWWNQTLFAASARNLVEGGVKSFVFAIIIVLVGCHNGLRVTGGARGVGLATTRAVVMDVFLIVVADLFFALVFYFSL
jgi:phospholipid/cholesterol/gamma-HCH transport system permease protein